MPYMNKSRFKSRSCGFPVNSRDSEPYGIAWRVQEGLLRASQYWKVEQLRKLLVASGDYCKGKASFLDSHSQFVARRP